MHVFYRLFSDNHYAWPTTLMRLSPFTQFEFKLNNQGTTQHNNWTCLRLYFRNYEHDPTKQAGILHGEDSIVGLYHYASLSKLLQFDDLLAARLYRDKSR